MKEFFFQNFYRTGEHNSSFCLYIYIFFFNFIILDIHIYIYIYIYINIKTLDVSVITNSRFQAYEIGTNT